MSLGSISGIPGGALLEQINEEIADIVADEYSSASTYAVGDRCIYDGKLYRCTTAITVAEAWTAAHWTAVDLDGEIDAEKAARESADTALSQAVAKTKNDIGIVEDTDTATHTIASGQYVIWKGDLYKATAAIPSGTALSLSNLSAVSGGGLNDLNSNLTAKTSIGYNNGTLATNITGSIRAVKFGKLCIVWVNVQASADTTTETIGTMPEGWRPSETYDSKKGIIIIGNDVHIWSEYIHILSNGTIYHTYSGGIANGTRIDAVFAYTLP